MKLFAIRLPDDSLLTSPRTGEVLYFDDKKAAKRLRDQNPGAVVVLGPDHVRFEG